MMLQKLFLGLVGGAVVIGGVYAYQTRADNLMIENKKQAIVLAYNAFFPDERNYNNPLEEYERDGLSDVLAHYERDERQNKIFFIPDTTNSFVKIQIEGVHYETFTPIDQSWARDKNSLYKDGKLFMQNAQVPKMMVGGAYMKNDTNVFFWREGMNNIIEGADAASFQTLYSLRYYNVVPYAKDKNSVYMLGDRIADIDPNSVEILTSFYLQDKKKIVYSDGESHRIVKLADRKTFEVIPDGEVYDAKDKNGYFWQGERVDIIEFD